MNRNTTTRPELWFFLEDAMFGFVKQALSELATEWRRQAAIRELNKLSDPLLADIGLRRDQLPTLALDLISEEGRAPAPMPAYRPELQPCG
jgi:uncharacterized protein YjiS (DUF1127 family)